MVLVVLMWILRICHHVLVVHQVAVRMVLVFLHHFWMVCLHQVVPQSKDRMVHLRQVVPQVKDQFLQVEQVEQKENLE